MTIRRRTPRAIVRDIDTHHPCAMYDGRTFVRFDAVGPRILQAPQGSYYDCVFKGRPLRLWQMYELDRWYTEEVESEAG